MKNLDQIRLNYEYTYSQLCILFGEEECGGKSRILQFKRWEGHFKWHTEGNTRARRFIITKVYPVIETQYKVNDQVFSSRVAAEKYAKSI